MEVILILSILALLAFVGVSCGIMGYSIAKENDWNLFELFRKVKFKLAKKSDLQKEILYRKETIKELKQQEQDWIELEKTRQEEEKMFEKIGSYEEKFRPLSDHKQIEKHYIEKDEVKKESPKRIVKDGKTYVSLREIHERGTHKRENEGEVDHYGLDDDEEEIVGAVGGREKKVYFYRDVVDGNLVHKGVILEEPIETNNFWKKMKKEQQEEENMRNLEEYKKIID